MPSPKRSTGARKIQQMSAKDFERSNSTADAFLGSTQRAWMTGQAPELLSKSSIAKPSCQTFRSPNSVPDTSVSTSPQTVLQPEAITTSTSAPRLPVEQTSIAADNVLPSPSPSLDMRRQSSECVNLIAVEDEVDNMFAPGGPLTAQLRELVAKLGSFEQVEKCLEEVDVVWRNSSSVPLKTTVNEDINSRSRPSSHSTSRRSPSKSLDQPHIALTIEGSAVTTSSKRTQKSASEARKKLHGLEEASQIESNGQPSVPARETNIEDASSFTTPVPADMQEFEGLVTRRIGGLAKLQDRQGVDVERPRLGLLYEACAREDYFYLCLHQLFCLDHKARHSNGRVPGLENVHRNGLNVLSYLLVPNEQLTSNAIDWFSIFPLPIETLSLAPVLQSAHQKVLECLERLASHWAVMRDMCGRRRYPPLVDEMVTLFKIDSFVFLQIIFRAILREIWMGQQDQCSQDTESIFPRNYADVMDRLKSQGLQSGVIQAYNLSIMTEYEHILEAHQCHAQPAVQRNMGPPHHAQSQSKITDINPIHLNRQNTSQSSGSSQILRPTSRHGPNLDTRVAQQHAPRPCSNPVVRPLSATMSHTAPVAGINSPSTQANSASPFHVFAQTSVSTPQSASSIRSPTSFRGFSNPASSTNLPAQVRGYWTNQPDPAGLGVSFISNSENNRNRAPTVLPSKSPINNRNDQHCQQQNLFGGYSQQQTPLLPPTNGYPHPSSRQQPRHQPEARTTLSRTGNEIQPPGPQHNRMIHFNTSPIPAQRNPTYSALHQAHLASPTMSIVEGHGSSNHLLRYFRFIESVIMPPEALSKKKKHLKWNFNIDPIVTSELAQDEPGFQGAPSSRNIKSGSRLCRIRCIKVASTAALPSQSEWVVAENTWPEGTVILLNGISLEVRKKSHYGKDLSIDATRHLRSGKNELNTAVIGLPQEGNLRYAIGVELIRVQEEQEIKRAIPSLPFEEARNRILERSSRLDPDVQALDAQTIVDLKDPFTAVQFKIPVRGYGCRHYHCFDRDVFLETRNAKHPDQPCEPEAFKCPICGGDARPPNLVIDGFLFAVRNKLQAEGRTEVKTVVLDERGDWEVDQEDEDTGESSDEEGTQDRPQAAELAEARAAKAPERTSREVIEID